MSSLWVGNAVSYLGPRAERGSQRAVDSFGHSNDRFMRIKVSMARCPKYLETLLILTNRCVTNIRKKQIKVLTNKRSVNAA